MKSNRFLDTPAAAELLGVKSCTLERWRWAGKGPAYLKIGRQVRYPENDTIEWAYRQKRQSTSEAA